MLRFLEWHAKWWMDRSDAIATTNKTLSKGHRAYAQRQAELRDQIAQLFAHTWRDTKCFLELADNIGEEGIA